MTLPPRLDLKYQAVDRSDEGAGEGAGAGEPSPLGYSVDGPADLGLADTVGEGGEGVGAGDGASQGPGQVPTDEPEGWGVQNAWEQHLDDLSNDLQQSLDKWGEGGFGDEGYQDYKEASDAFESARDAAKGSRIGDYSGRPPGYTGNVSPPEGGGGISPSAQTVPPPEGGGISPSAQTVPPPGGGVSPSAQTVPPPGGGVSPSAQTVPAPGGGVSPSAQTVPPPEGGQGGTSSDPTGEESSDGSLPPKP